MSRLTLSAIALSLAVSMPAPSFAIDWLGNRIESNLENNLRNHQQQGARQHNRRLKKERNTRQHNRAMSPAAERQARAEGQRIMESHRPRLEREYRRRVARQGKASADRWLRRESFAIGARVGRQMMQKYAGR